MQKIHASFEPPKNIKVVCPICKRSIDNYLQDMYDHVVKYHMDQVRGMSTDEELKLFEKGFTYDRNFRSTNNN